MRISTKLGITALITAAALQVVAAVIRPPAGIGDPLALVYTMAKHEAVISVQWLSVASLATGVIAMIYAGYRRLWPAAGSDRSPDGSAAAGSAGIGFLALGRSIRAGDAIRCPPWRRGHCVASSIAQAERSGAASASSMNRAPRTGFS